MHRFIRRKCYHLVLLLTCDITISGYSDGKTAFGTVAEQSNRQSASILDMYLSSDVTFVLRDFKYNEFRSNYYVLIEKKSCVGFVSNFY